jgi:twitching motility protein PilT
VAEAARAAVADAVPSAVADAIPDAVAEAARSAVADAAPNAVAAAASSAVAEAARAAVAEAAPGAVSDAARIAVAGVVGAVVGEAARVAVAGAVPGAVGDAARAAVTRAAPEAVASAARAAVGEAAREAVAEAAHAAVAEAVSATVAHAVPAAVEAAARASVATVVPGAVAEAVRASVAGAVPDAVADAVTEAVRTTVAGAVPAAVADAARAAVTDAAPWAIAEAARAIVVETARAAVTDAARAAVAEVVPAAVAAAARTAAADAAASIRSDVTPRTAFPFQRSGDRSSPSIAKDTYPPPAASPRIAPPYEVPPPISRSPIRDEASQPPPAVDTQSGLVRLLRIAAAYGASTLYVPSNARPSVRVDGQVHALDSEPVHTASDVMSLLTTLMPDRREDVRQTGATREWICDLDDVGRVRCASFDDHGGPVGVFRIMPARVLSVDELGLSREIQTLAFEPQGLVLVAGPRSSGKRTLMTAFVDLINRTRQAHVITIEREVNIVHAQGNSVISQREVRGTDDDVLAAARAALREEPDVLVLEQIRTGSLMTVALEAAASGQLVIGGFSARNATESIDRIIDLYTPEYTPRQAQLALADNLRGVIAQVLLATGGGGRVAAREVLLNTGWVPKAIADGKTSQLPVAIEAGRRHGMVPLTDALIAYVRNGIVDVGEAYRHVADRPAFLELLKRQGMDTSTIERVAQSPTTSTPAR